MGLDRTHGIETREVHTWTVGTVAVGARWIVLTHGLTQLPQSWVSVIRIIKRMDQCDVLSQRSNRDAILAERGKGSKETWCGTNTARSQRLNPHNLYTRRNAYIDPHGGIGTYSMRPADPLGPLAGSECMRPPASSSSPTCRAMCSGDRL